MKNRPEVGNSLRNKLVRLMTHIDTDVKHCAAEFLFVLCKESGESQGLVARFGERESWASQSVGWVALQTPGTLSSLGLDALVREESGVCKGLLPLMPVVIGKLC